MQFLGPKEVLDVIACTEDVHTCLEKCKSRVFVEEELPNLIEFIMGENLIKVLIGVFGLRKLSANGYLKRVNNLS